MEERSLDHLERRLELVLDLELARRRELDLGHHLVCQHRLEVDFPLVLFMRLRTFTLFFGSVWALGW